MFEDWKAFPSEGQDIRKMRLYAGCRMLDAGRWLSVADVDKSQSKFLFSVSAALNPVFRPMK